MLERAHQEPGSPATIVFNGDFHWLDVDPDDFRTISETVLAHYAINGNVEAKPSQPSSTDPRMEFIGGTQRGRCDHR